MTTEWFATLQDRATWIARTDGTTVEIRPLVRLTDDDEHGTLLGKREVISLPALASDAREEARQAGLNHATIRHQIAAVELRAVWPTATVVVADLAAAVTGEGNVFIEEIRDASGAAIWTQDTCLEAVDRAEEQLSIALDFSDQTAAGWHRLTDAQLTGWAGSTNGMGDHYMLHLPVKPPLPNAFGN